MASGPRNSNFGDDEDRDEVDLERLDLDPLENDEKCRGCAQHAAHGKCQNAKHRMRGPQET